MISWCLLEDGGIMNRVLREWALFLCSMRINLPARGTVSGDCSVLVLSFLWGLSSLEILGAVCLCFPVEKKISFPASELSGIVWDVISLRAHSEQLPGIQGKVYQSNTGCCDCDAESCSLGLQRVVSVMGFGDRVTSDFLRKKRWLDLWWDLRQRGQCSDSRDQSPLRTTMIFLQTFSFLA